MQVTRQRAHLGRFRRVLLIVAAAFVLALVLLQTAAIRRDHDAAIGGTETTTRDLAMVVEQFARRTLETSDLLAMMVADRIAMMGGVEAFAADRHAHDMLKALTDRSSGDYLMVVDAAARPVALSAQRDPPAVSLADRRWFRAHLAGEERHIGEALYSRITEEILFTYSLRLPKPDGRLDGAVQVSTRPGFFQDAAFANGTTEGAILTMWDRDGRIIARTGLVPDDLARDASHGAIFRQFGPAPQGTFRSSRTFDGRERIITWRRLPDWPVVVSVSIPVESGLGPFRRALAGTLWVGFSILVALGALVGFAMLLARREEEAQRDLAAANAALVGARDALERRVEERTRDLAEANHRLRDSEARFRGIFDATFQLIGLLAPDGTLLEANETALRFRGIAAEEVVGRHFANTPWWPQDATTQERLRAALRRAAAGEFVRYEVEILGAGEARALIDFSLKPVRDETGAVAMLVPEGRDITALKAAQAQLHEAQKLETLGQLTGGVAHDFNNLLMAVLGNLSLLRKRLPEDARMHRLLDGAVQGAQRGATLTQRLLAFARRQELNPQPTDLARLVGGMSDLLERSLGPAIALSVEIPPNLPPVLADANQLELALLNLALNARDAMPDGGRLRITADAGVMDRPPGLPPGDHVRIAVRDSGTGMDAATLARATEPFFTTKGPGKGSGLGLSMVHGLAAQSGGKLVLTSAAGEGTTVALWLPVAAAGETVVPAPPVMAPPGVRPLSVLLVDDDPLIIPGTVAMLEDLGHRVTAAPDGLAALEALRRQGFDLLITDFAMPGMNGLALIRAAAAVRPGLPAILASGFANLPEGEAIEVPRLAKPYDQAQLAAAIARAIGSAAGTDVFLPREAARPTPGMASPEPAELQAPA